MTKKKTVKNEKTQTEIRLGIKVTPWNKDGAEFNEIPPKSIGFVYKIIHLPTGKGYIGRKLFWFSKTKQEKGKKKKVKAESDWRSYWGSCQELCDLVDQEGQQNFSREILHIGYNKGTLNYLEAREQMDNRVLENPDRWFNG